MMIVMLLRNTQMIWAIRMELDLVEINALQMHFRYSVVFKAFQF